MKLIVLLCTLAFAAPAAANPKIVLESYTGGKTEDASRRIAPLLEALANSGFVGGYEALGRTLEARVSRPAVQRGLPADFAAQIETGHRAFFGGKFEDAIKILAPLIDMVFANSGAFAKDQDAREGLQKALVALALSQHRMGDPPATRQTFSELLRCFPTFQLPRATYGAEAADVFEKVRREVTGAGRGKLVVRSNVDGAVIFINEKFEAAGTVHKDNLLAGEYRVFAQLGKQLSRAHRVTVRANETATLVIDAGFDIAVQTSPTWTGLAFQTSADRERSEVSYAAQFGNALDADAIAVVGIDQVRGRDAIVGVLVNRISGTEIRRGSVALDPAPPDERLKALAEFLAGANLKPEGVDVIFASEQPRPTGTKIVGPVETPRDGRWGGWKFIAGGLGLAAVGTGIGLLALDGGCKETVPVGTQCPNVWSVATPGYLALGGGVVLVAVSVYLFVKKDGPTRTAYVAPTGDGVVVGFAGRF